MPETVTSIKTTFINSQVRLLNRPLELPDGLTAKSDISSKDLDHAMREANLRLRRHNKTVYDALAVRSIAEQIDSLYWNAAEPRNPIDDTQDADEDIIRKGDDLTDLTSLDRLPEELSSSEEYAELYKTLRSLAERRRDLAQKLEALQVLKERLKPLEDPQTSVQPNLISREASMNQDLADTKRLGLRAAAQAASMKKPRNNNNRDLNLGESERTKLLAALKSLD